MANNGLKLWQISDWEPSFEGHILAPLQGKVVKLEDRLPTDLAFNWTTLYTFWGIVNREIFLWNGTGK